MMESRPDVTGSAVAAPAAAAAVAGVNSGALPQTAKAGPKLGRNDPCWCGSGKKYKRCHGA
jgi:preprotein translocase subunit SecA